MSALPAKHLFTTQEWHHFAAIGFFAPGYRAELIEGEIIDMPPIGTDHGSCVDWLTHYFSKNLPDSMRFRVQNPITLGDLSEPEPDFSIVHYRSDYYRHAHPTPQDVLLVIEVSDTTLSYDRNTKAPLYATHAMPEYWIINLVEQCVEVYRQPQQGQYREQQVLRGENKLCSLQVAEIEIMVKSLFW